MVEITFTPELNILEIQVLEVILEDFIDDVGTTKIEEIIAQRILDEVRDSINRG